MPVARVSGHAHGFATLHPRVALDANRCERAGGGLARCRNALRVCRCGAHFARAVGVRLRRVAYWWCDQSAFGFGFREVRAQRGIVVGADGVVFRGAVERPADAARGRRLLAFVDGGLAGQHRRGGQITAFLGGQRLLGQRAVVYAVGTASGGQVGVNALGHGGAQVADGVGTGPGAGVELGHGSTAEPVGANLPGAGQEVDVVVALVAFPIGGVDGHQDGNPVPLHEHPPEIHGQRVALGGVQFRGQRHLQFTCHAGVGPRLGQFVGVPELLGVAAPLGRAGRGQLVHADHAAPAGVVVKQTGAHVLDFQPRAVRRRRGGTVAFPAAEGDDVGVVDGDGGSRSASVTPP